MPRILPLRSDTDGDGLPDADEVAGLSSGVPDLDLVPRESRFVGVLRPALRSGGASDAGSFPTVTTVPRRIFLTATPHCSVHGPAPVVRASNLNAAGPYRWTVNNENCVTEGAELIVLTPPRPDGTHHVSCVWSEDNFTPPVRANMTDISPFLFLLNISRPAIYQGNNVQKYMQCRPSLPTGIQSEP